MNCYYFTLYIEEVILYNKDACLKSIKRLGKKKDALKVWAWFTNFDHTITPNKLVKIKKANKKPSCNRFFELLLSIFSIEYFIKID